MTEKEIRDIHSELDEQLHEELAQAWENGFAGHHSGLYYWGAYRIDSNLYGTSRMIALKHYNEEPLELYWTEQVKTVRIECYSKGYMKTIVELLGNDITHDNIMNCINYFLKEC